MPLAFGPWKRTTTTTSLIALIRGKRVEELLLIVEHAGRRLDDRDCQSLTAETLITPRPSEPSSTRMPPSCGEGVVG